MDTAGVVRRVQRIFGDSANIQITQQDIFDWMNEGQLRIVRETECLMKSQSFDSVYGVPGPFALPTDFVKMKRVSWKGNKIVETTRESVEDYVANSQMANSTYPQYWYLQGREMWLWGGPDETSTASIQALYVNAPVDIASIADPIGIPLIHHEALVRFCLMRANELNENEQAVRRLNDDVFSQLGESRQDAQQQSDTYPVIGDYVGDQW